MPNKTFFQLYSSEEKTSIERGLLLQVLIISLMGIALYLIDAVFINPSAITLRDSCFAFILYFGLFVWVYYYESFKYRTEIVFWLLAFSCYSGFFVLGGYRGVPSFDILNLFLLCVAIFENKKRTIFLLVLSISCIVLYYIQISLPHLIVNRFANNPDWHQFISLILRFLFSINIGLAFHNAFLSEHKKVKKLLSDVQELNRDVNNQNEELIRMQEELKSNNENLEQLVQIRTKKLETQNEKLVMYAYMNSHIFRGPISRAQGLLNLLELEAESGKREELFQLLTKEIQNVDNVIRDISIMIYEQDQQLMDELRMKAKKLYGRQD